MSEKPKHTPKPWHKGHGSFIIATHPVNGLIGSDDVEYYGGHLVCESVAPQNMDLIAAAPELLEALEAIVAFDTPLPCGLLKQARAAIAKAKP